MVYLYGLREGAAAAAEVFGLDGTAMDWVSGEGWSAAVSPIAARPELTAVHLATHDDAARRAAAGAAFLPARFGQVFADPPALVAAMAPRAAAIRGALELVRGCVQMTVRLFGDAAQAAAAAPALGPGARFLAGRRAAATPPPAAGELRELLGDLVVAERWLRSAAPGLMGTLAHLVREASIDRYRAAIPEGPLGAVRSLRVSGPWLPYAFAPGFEP